MSRILKLFTLVLAALAINACGNSSNGIESESELGVTAAQQPGVIATTLAKPELGSTQVQQATLDFNHYAEQSLADLNKVLEEGDKAGISATNPNEVTLGELGKILDMTGVTDVKVQEAAIAWQLQLYAFQSKSFSDAASLHEELKKLTQAAQNLKIAVTSDLNALGVPVQSTLWDGDLPFTEVQQALYTQVTQKLSGTVSQDSLEAQLVKQETARLLRASALSLGGQAFTLSADLAGLTVRFQAAALRSPDTISLRSSITDAEALRALQAEIAGEAQATDLALQDLQVQYRSATDAASRDRIVTLYLGAQAKLDSLAGISSGFSSITLR